METDLLEASGNLLLLISKQHAEADNLAVGLDYR